MSQFYAFKISNFPTKRNNLPMKRFLILLLFAPLFFLVSESTTLLSTCQAAPLLEKITFDAPSPGRERISFKLNGAHIPKTFAFDDGKQPKVVFDFFGVEPAESIKREIKTDGAFIKRIRTGRHEDVNPKTRVVLDLQAGIKVNFDQQFDGKTNTLVITLSKADAPAAPKSAATRKTAPAKPSVKEPGIADKEARWQKELKEKQAVAPVAEQKSPPPAAETASKPTAPATTAPPPPTLTDDPGPIVPKAGKTPKLFSVEFDNTSERGEMILFQLNDFYPPVVFGIEEGSPRVVCDFMATEMGQKVLPLIEANGQFVQTIRTAAHHNPEKIRTVIDLRPKNNYDLQQVFFKDEDLFILIVNTLKEDK